MTQDLSHSSNHFIAAMTDAYRCLPLWVGLLSLCGCDPSAEKDSNSPSTARGFVAAASADAHSQKDSSHVGSAREAIVAVLEYSASDDAAVAADCLQTSCKKVEGGWEVMVGGCDGGLHSVDVYHVTLEGSVEFKYSG